MRVTFDTNPKQPPRSSYNKFPPALEVQLITGSGCAAVITFEGGGEIALSLDGTRWSLESVEHSDDGRIRAGINYQILHGTSDWGPVLHGALKQTLNPKFVWEQEKRRRQEDSDNILGHLVSLLQRQQDGPLVNVGQITVGYLKKLSHPPHGGFAIFNHMQEQGLVQILHNHRVKYIQLTEKGLRRWEEFQQ